MKPLYEIYHICIYIFLHLSSRKIQQLFVFFPEDAFAKIHKNVLYYILNVNLQHDYRRNLADFDFCV